MKYIPDFNWFYMVGKHVASKRIFLAPYSLESTQHHSIAGLLFLTKKEVMYGVNMTNEPCGSFQAIALGCTDTGVGHLGLSC